VIKAYQNNINKKLEYIFSSFLFLKKDVLFFKKKDRILFHNFILEKI